MANSDVGQLKKRLETIQSPKLAAAGSTQTGMTTMPHMGGRDKIEGAFDDALATGAKSTRPGDARRGFKDVFRDGKPLDGQEKTTNAADIAAEMLGEDSLIMQRAATEGMQFANRRGLLNSSMAAQAAQGAVVDRITPLAQQEAEHRFQRDFSEQQSGERIKEMHEQGGIASNLSSQEAAQEGVLQDRRLENERFVANLDADTREHLLGMERDMRESLAAMEIGNDQRNQMSNMITSMHELYQQSMQSTLSNPNLPASERQALLRSASELLGLQTDLVSGLYDFDFDWDVGSFDPNTPSSDQKAETDTTSTQPETPPRPTRPQYDLERGR